MKNKKKNKKIIIFRIISIIIIIVCLIVLAFWQQDNTANNDIQEELNEYVEEISDETTITDTETNEETSIPISNLNVDFDSLKQQNSDTVGWISVPNTNIDYAVVQSSDNSYYLTHNFNKESNKAGWIFADYANNFDTLDQNTIIYGHNRVNGSMFSNLTYLLDTSWYSTTSNMYFSFSTESQNYIAQIFSVYKIVSRKCFTCHKLCYIN